MEAHKSAQSGRIWDASNYQPPFYASVCLSVADRVGRIVDRKPTQEK
jgi:hypothetical protein